MGLGRKLFFIASIHIPTRNSINEKILFNNFEYLSFLNFVPIKSPNNVHKLNETKLFNVKIRDIKIIFGMFWLLSKKIENIKSINSFSKPHF